MAQFDTLECVRRLEDAGVEREQAEAHARIYADMIMPDLATKADLRMEIGSVKADLLVEIRSVRSDLKAEIGSLRTDLQAEIGSVRADLQLEIGALQATMRRELKEEIASVRGDLKTEASWVRSEFGAVRAELKGVEGRLERRIVDQARLTEHKLKVWFGGMQAATVGLLVTILKLL